MAKQRLIVKVYINEVADVAGSLKTTILDAIIENMGTVIRGDLRRGQIAYLECSTRNPEQLPGSILVEITGVTCTDKAKLLRKSRTKTRQIIEHELGLDDNSVAVVLYRLPPECFD